MELRVWVDGTQRVVCGVKLTTTCQEIVFALAHATQQAGRFTMIERWRNNERLLSPNEQPLVTLQRWGDHMNEVEFILRKTSTHQTQAEQSQVSKNHNFEDLYSTINKKRTSQPPAVPAKPRIVGPVAQVTNIPLSAKPRIMGPVVPVTNIPLSNQQMKPINNTQVNFYHQNPSPLNMYPANLRPRHPPGYLDYMEAMANRNSLTQTVLPNKAYSQFYNLNNTVNPSPVNSSNSSGRYHYLSDNQLPDHHPPPESTETNNQNASFDNGASSISRMGHDMLKVIEEQKKVLINQKNELERLDNDQEYWESKQKSEQNGLINRIEDEIHQLEELWKENQTQIKKLESQDFDKELEELKSELIKMEIEIGKQREKLVRCEKDIDLCKGKIDKLKTELTDQLSNRAENPSSSEDEHNELTSNGCNQIQIQVSSFCKQSSANNPSNLLELTW